MRVGSGCVGTNLMGGGEPDTPGWTNTYLVGGGKPETPRDLQDV